MSLTAIRAKTVADTSHMTRQLFLIAAHCHTDHFISLNVFFTNRAATDWVRWEWHSDIIVLEGNELVFELRRGLDKCNSSGQD